MKLTKKRLAQIIKEEYQRIEEEEHADPVGAGIEDISADDVLGNQDMDFEKIAQIDPELSDVFKALILRNPLLFPGQTERSVDLLRNDPDAVEASLAAIPDELPDYPLEEEEEGLDSLVKEIQNLLKDPRSTS